MFENVNPDLKEKAKDCKSPEEMLKLAEEEGVELSDEELEKVTGGWGGDDDGSPVKCIECGGSNVEGHVIHAGGSNAEEYYCWDCGASWSSSV